MPPAVLDRSALDPLFSRASHWPSDGDWNRVARDTAKHLIEHPKTGMLMVLVPAGKFLTDTGGGAPFEVDLPAYFAAVHPVTNAQYARFVAETRRRKPEQPPYEPVWKNMQFLPGMADHPVVFVDWEDATAYCRWAGLRLPTELEWEKATRSLDGRAYPWGEEWDPNRCCSAGGATTGVWRYGQGGAPFGGLQLSGNVLEWCADWHDKDAYDRYRQRNLTAPSSGQWRVVRGKCSASARDWGNPGMRNHYRGFRCVGGMGASP